MRAMIIWGCFAYLKIQLSAFSSYKILADNIWREKVEEREKVERKFYERSLWSNFEETLTINLKKRERKKKEKKKRRGNLEYSRIYFAVMWIR